MIRLKVRTFSLLFLVAFFCSSVFFLRAEAKAQSQTKIQSSYDGTGGFNLPLWIMASTDIWM